MTIVVPFAPAGPNDLMGRALGERLGNATGRTVIVDNKAGAASIIGADYVARAKPDGNTLLLATQTTLAANQFLYKTLPYDPVRSFIPVALLSQQPAVLVVPAASPATSATDLVERIRRSPTAWSYGSAGSGTIHHLTAELLRSTENLQLVHVPYKGSGPALMDLIAGRIQFMFVDLSSAAPHIKSGALRPLLVAGPRRLKALPQVPTGIETGLRSLSLSAWAVLAAPAATPPATVEALNREVNAAIQKLAADDRFTSAGVDLRGDLSVQQVNEFIKADRPVWEQVIRRSGATAE
ncbi:MAG TPA: tripartite tricarboxylate transporter substrate-binding protein [Ramlibacter sp.]|nr:tripartite tricarboxylate transporter substrate-binding protein [Ramlibacter sp.]